MRKVLLLLTLLVGGVFFEKAIAQTPQDITLEIIDKSVIGGGSTKTPVQPLVITHNGNVLTFLAQSVDYELQLLDENGLVVYSLFVPAGTTYVVLPTWLIGCFEIRFVAATYYYYGFIEL